MKICDLFTEDELKNFEELMKNDLQKIELLISHKLPIDDTTQYKINTYYYIYNYICNPFNTWYYERQDTKDYFIIYILFDMLNKLFDDTFDDISSIEFFQNLRNLYDNLNNEVQ